MAGRSFFMIFSCFWLRICPTSQPTIDHSTSPQNYFCSLNANSWLGNHANGSSIVPATVLKDKVNEMASNKFPHTFASAHEPKNDLSKEAHEWTLKKFSHLFVLEPAPAFKDEVIYERQKVHEWAFKKFLHLFASAPAFKDEVICEHLSRSWRGFLTTSCLHLYILCLLYLYLLYLPLL